MRVLVETYAAFNARDIDAVLAVMHPDVEWPNGMEGGTLIPEAFTTMPDGRVAVQVRQIVRDLAGTVLKDGIVRHVYTFDGDRIVAMTID